MDYPKLSYKALYGENLSCDNVISLTIEKLGENGRLTFVRIKQRTTRLKRHGYANIHEGERNNEKAD